MTFLPCKMMPLASRHSLGVCGVAAVSGAISCHLDQRKVALWAAFFALVEVALIRTTTAAKNKDFYSSKRAVEKNDVFALQNDAPGIKAFFRRLRRCRSKRGDILSSRPAQGRPLGGLFCLILMRKNFRR